MQDSLIQNFESAHPNRALVDGGRHAWLPAAASTYGPAWWLPLPAQLRPQEKMTRASYSFLATWKKDGHGGMEMEPRACLRLCLVLQIFQTFRHIKITSKY